MVCDETKMDYIMIMEDDVWVREHFDIDSPFALRGVRHGGPLKQKLLDEIKNLLEQMVVTMVCVEDLFTMQRSSLRSMMML